MAQKAHNKGLQDAFKSHIQETKTHIERLKQVFEMLDEPVKAKKCEAMAGLAKEAEHIVEDTPPKTAIRDCALIVAAQKVEHYEIASYGCLRTLVRMLGYDDAAEILQVTLDEEHATNDHLTMLAESYINEDAQGEGE
jgi:ferritin-like metal-binding protein YciE